MDKSWMSRPRYSPEFINGVQNFIEFASHHLDSRGMILCPCRSCYNQLFQTPNEVRNHLITKGIYSGYVIWNRHGEQGHPVNETVNTNTIRFTEDIPIIQDNFVGADDIEGLFRDTIGASNVQNNIGGINVEGEQHNFQASSDNISGFAKLSQQASQELYPGCKKYSKLSFILHLYQLKCLNSWTATSFDMLLELLIDALPSGTILPKNTYEVKKLMKEFDLGYNKIDACPNDCMLFWGDMSDKVECQKCGTSRWANNEKLGKKQVKKKSAKIVRYFPLIPRLQRMFKTEQSAEDMTWHEKHRQKDGLLRHPADGEAWKSFDARHPEFSSDPRNLRLGLTSDGFNPFKTLSSTYSIWPIVLVNYNLPPWIGMKQSSFILSTIIPGEKSPGNDIDIYLQPLIHELKQLWNGISSYDAASKQTFNLRVALLWTINDFPAYAMLSGWSTKGRYACPCCAEQTSSIWLRNGKKFAFMGHRRWLPTDHIYRRQKRNFDGTEESRTVPNRSSGSEILAQVDTTVFPIGKAVKANNKGKGKKRTLDEVDSQIMLWKKKVFSMTFLTGSIIYYDITWMSCT